VNTWAGHGKTCAGKDPATYNPAVSSFGKSCGAEGEDGNLDCPDLLTDTKCEEAPLDNLSRLMVLQIFSSDNEAWLDRWDQFGPMFPDAGIIRCMRCAGSGTHATFDMQVFRTDADIQGTSIDNRFYHHLSSSDLARCISRNGTDEATPPWDPDVRYAVGYADVDKALKSSSYPNLHLVKYQGVEAKRTNIENSQYNFWAAQTLYWNTTEISNLGLDSILSDLITAAQSSTFLTSITPQNMFWTTNGEMASEKSPEEYSYPTVKEGTTPY
jgi:hypothetical protein